MIGGWGCQPKKAGKVFSEVIPSSKKGRYYRQLYSLEIAVCFKKKLFLTSCWVKPWVEDFLLGNNFERLGWIIARNRLHKICTHPVDRKEIPKSFFQELFSINPVNTSEKSTFRCPKKLLFPIYEFAKWPFPTDNTRNLPATPLKDNFRIFSVFFSGMIPSQWGGFIAKCLPYYNFWYRKSLLNKIWPKMTALESETHPLRFFFQNRDSCFLGDCSVECFHTFIPPSPLSSSNLLPYILNKLFFSLQMARERMRAAKVLPKALLEPSSSARDRLHRVLIDFL